MNLHYTTVLTALLATCALQAQTFVRTPGLLTMQNARTGNCVGIVDMDGDGRDDLLLLHQSMHLYIDYQNADGSFTQHAYGQVSNGYQWGWTVGDMSGTGHKDVISGGNQTTNQNPPIKDYAVHYTQISSIGAYVKSTLPNGSGMFMQTCNTADLDNDGDLDFFACHDVGTNRTWRNNGSGTLTHHTGWFNFNTTPPSDNSGNYGSVFIDIDNDGDMDLYIAKCRQGVNNPADPRRINQLYINNGNGTYTEQAAAWGINSNEQDWTGDFGDIDNDGDLDLVLTNHSNVNQGIKVYRNNGNSTFTDITNNSGIQVIGSFYQAKLEDFDNDGYLDLLTAGGSSGAERYFRGNGNGTFTQINNMLPKPSGYPALNSFSVGDLNSDGFLDVYGTYGSGYVTPSSTRDDQLYLNAGNNNGFLNFRLRGTQSNRDAVGARVTLYGPWGTQIREVRAGESYGIVCSFTCHFGMGTAPMADSAIVRWPSGIVDKLYNVAASQWIDLVEGETMRSRVSARAYLGGAYVSGTGLMNDNLRSGGHIPTTNPYSAIGLEEVGGKVPQKIAPAVLAITGPNAIVDWVWLELRSAGNPGSIVRARPALLQRDGDIVELDGYRPVYMSVNNGLYHVAVRHRNHLGCMTSGTFNLGAAPTTVNLSASATTTWGTNARRSDAGVMVLWTGNTNNDDLVKYTGASNDRDPVLTRIGGNIPTATVTGYHLEDVNLDAVVKYTGSANDRDPILLTIGGVVPTNTRIEQLP